MTVGRLVLSLHPSGKRVVPKRTLATEDTLTVMRMGIGIE